MVQYLDEMKDYIRIAGDSSSLDIEPATPIIVESKENDKSIMNEDLIAELDHLVFKLRSYRELSEDQKYATGIEEGLNLAAEMLERAIERYQSK